MAVESDEVDWESRSDRRLSQDPWTRWLTSQDCHFQHGYKEDSYWGDIPLALFVGFCLTQIIKNL
jgi:hypothetical protein